MPSILLFFVFARGTFFGVLMASSWSCRWNYGSNYGYHPYDSRFSYARVRSYLTDKRNGQKKGTPGEKKAKRRKRRELKEGKRKERREGENQGIQEWALIGYDQPDFWIICNVFNRGSTIQRFLSWVQKMGSSIFTSKKQSTLRKISQALRPENQIQTTNFRETQRGRGSGGGKGLLCPLPPAE